MKRLRKKENAYALLPNNLQIDTSMAKQVIEIQESINQGKNVLITFEHAYNFEVKDASFGIVSNTNYYVVEIYFYKYIVNNDSNLNDNKIQRAFVIAPIVMEDKGYYVNNNEIEVLELKEINDDTSKLPNAINDIKNFPIISRNNIEISFSNVKKLDI